MSKFKQYLGDGVYADHDGEHIVLTAEDGIRATDRIYLDPTVYAALTVYFDQLGTLARATCVSAISLAKSPRCSVMSRNASCSRRTTRNCTKRIARL